MTELIIITLLIIAIILLIIFGIKNNSSKGVPDYFNVLSDNQKQIGEMQNARLNEIRNTLSESMKNENEIISDRLNALEKRFLSLEQTNEQRLENLRKSVTDSLEKIRTDNNTKLEAMQKTVDEKLEKTLERKMSESFKLVSERLEQVYKGLGEMQTLAGGVGDLKKVLTNVKSRGILGEIQLGAILENILSPDQYETNFAVVPGSTLVVEYAIKLPGDGETPVYLPIDSKFPADCYLKLQDAYETGDAQLIKTATAEMVTRVKSFAKDIKTKYIAPPHTTDFAIMFLPSEGLYAEVIRCGLIETLQQEYHVNIAGPSTMSAMVSSLQMGFRTLAIQKRSAEVWKILGAVRTEFDKFQEVLDKTRKKLSQIDGDLDSLIGRRSNAIRRKLRDVERLSDDESENLLEDNIEIEED